MRLLVLVLVVMGCGRTAPYTYRDPPPLPEDAGFVDGGVDFCSEGGCDANALCTNQPTGPACVCKPGFEGDGRVCTSIAAKLDGLRWELPCLKSEPQAPDYVCLTTPDVSFSTTLTGAPGKRYDLRLRIRGVVETKQYLGGAGDGGHWVIGGTPRNDAWNIYRLTLSSPQQTHHLNHGDSGLYQCVGVDYVIKVRAAAGAKVTLFASAVDANLSQIRNNVANPIVIPLIAPAPKSYDGQFLQLDVLSVVEVP